MSVIVTEYNGVKCEVVPLGDSGVYECRVWRRGFRPDPWHYACIFVAATPDKIGALVCAEDQPRIRRAQASGLRVGMVELLQSNGVFQFDHDIRTVMGMAGKRAGFDRWFCTTGDKRIDGKLHRTDRKIALEQ